LAVDDLLRLPTELDIENLWKTSRMKKHGGENEGQMHQLQKQRRRKDDEYDVSSNTEIKALSAEPQLIGTHRELYA
jgi:hypothetical protein